MTQCHPRLQLSVSSQSAQLFPVASLGCDAASILRQGHVGRVVAVFQRSFYVQCNEHMICIGTATLGEGPMHILLEHDSTQLLPKVSNGESIELSWQFDAGMKTSAPLFSGQINLKTLNPISLNLIRQRLRYVEAVTEQGFGWIINNDEVQQFSTELDVLTLEFRKQCAPGLMSLVGFLTEALDESNNSDLALTSTAQGHFHALLGAGPGLTPAGDDLLAGVLLALHCLDHTRIAESLWRLLQPHLDTRTNAISAAHLQLAAKGQCAAPMFQLIDKVFCTNQSRKADIGQTEVADIHALACRIGATSGWDTLAGVSLVIKAI